LEPGDANGNRIKTVVEKPHAEQGRYLHPELYGKARSLGLAPASALRNR
jgi:hypothetical protein